MRADQMFILRSPQGTENGKVKSLTILLVYLLLLFSLPAPVIATTPGGGCPDCKKWDPYLKDCVNACKSANCEECVDGVCKGCDPNKFCCPGSHYGTCCDPNECDECVGGVCKPCGGDLNKKCCPDKNPHYCCPSNQTCCQGKCCDKLNCEECTGGVCVSDCDSNQFCCPGSRYGTCCNNGQECCTTYYYGAYNPFCCDPNFCETCVGSPDGQCKTCGGDLTKCCVNGKCVDKCAGGCCEPNQYCCGGEVCCDKVWTKKTINSSIEPCSSCEYIPGEPMCDGTTTEIESYQKCSNVGVGQGEHCECHDTLQPVGFTYECMINWDVSKLLWCAELCVCCAIQCVGAYADPASCADCLITTQADCCGGGCDICDFVEECKKDPYKYIEKKKLAFSSFGC